MISTASPKMLLSYFVFLHIGTSMLEATACFIGQELGTETGGKGTQWVLPYRHSCDCTSIAPGGLNVVSPSRSFAPREFPQPLAVHGVQSVRRALEVECSDAVTQASDVTTATEANKPQSTKTIPPNSDGLSCGTSTTSVTTFTSVFNYPFAEFEPSVEQFIKFGVRAEYGALLCLAATNNGDQDSVYEIVLEDGDTQLSGIRRCVNCKYETTVHSGGDLLDGAVFQYLWLRYLNGSIDVGLKGRSAFLSWQDPAPIRNIRYLGVASPAPESTIDWTFCNRMKA